MSPECDPVSLGRLYTALRLALEEGEASAAGDSALRHAIIVNALMRMGAVRFESQKLAPRATPGEDRRRLWRRQIIDCMKAIMRESNSNSRTSAKRSPPSAAAPVGPSLSWNSSRA
jgi:hypothetical protein